METRKITVVSTRNQKKSVIMSAATTLAELKIDLRQNGIDYDGMTFYEGTSKVELRDNASVLPHDVPYKGQTTNELVFMLTDTNKKIRSGADMSRADAYAAIKAKDLQDECIRRFGKNFTICKTADLIILINEKSAREEREEVKRQADTTEYVDIKARAALYKLLTILGGVGALITDEVEEVKDILNGEIEIDSDSISPYSDYEIDRMFDFTK